MANALDAANQFKSKTEAMLRTTPLNSAGRVAIDRAIKADLAFLNDIPGTTWSVTTNLDSPNRLSISVTINGKEFYYEWNPDSLFLTYQIR